MDKQASAAAMAAGAARGIAVRQRNANEKAERVRAEVEQLRGQGITSLKAIAQALNQRGVPTPRGGKARWYAMSVSLLLRRLSEKRGG